MGERIGPPPQSEADAQAQRRARDDEVRRLVPGAEQADLRNPAEVRALLTRVGISVPDTRSWRLEPLRGTHPVVDALLAWRKTERIATTYGWSWLERVIGPDGRLRGRWSGSDGGAGRMTAQAFLAQVASDLGPDALHHEAGDVRGRPVGVEDKQHGRGARQGAGVGRKDRHVGHRRVEPARRRSRLGGRHSRDETDEQGDGKDGRQPRRSSRSVRSRHVTSRSGAIVRPPARRSGRC